MGTKTKAEQIGVNGRWIRYRPGTRKLLKRVSNKIMRRMFKFLGEDAPRKLPFKGYDD